VKQEKAMTKLLELRNRRGMTLVLMASMLTLLIGVSAFAVDFGRMYMFHAQLRSAADASALAGVVTLANGHGTMAADSAVSFDGLNRVGDSTNTLVSTDVEPGTWDGTFHAAPLGWTDPTANAVRTTTHYTGAYVFGRVFGFSRKLLTARAVAVHGSVGRAACVRPWAVPYQLLLNQLAGTGTPHDALTYQLTPADVAQLNQTTSATNIDLKIGSQTGTWSPTNGNFYGVKLPPQEYADGTQGNPWSGGNDFRDATGGTCAQITTMLANLTPPASPVMGIGDWLAPENGNMAGPTQQGVAGQGGNPGLCGSNTCSPPVRVVVAMWAETGNAPHFPSGCGGKCFKIKYLGIFYVSGYNTTTNAIQGYFSGLLNAAGGFVNAAGPIQKNALVQ
jgi:Flp pilus assembly protein TadG